LLALSRTEKKIEGSYWPDERHSHPYARRRSYKKSHGNEHIAGIHGMSEPPIWPPDDP